MSREPDPATAERAPEEGLRERVEAEDDDQPTGFPGYGDSWLPPAQEAAERVLAFVSWYGDGLVVVESMEPDDQPPLFARDLEAVAKSSAAASEAAPTAGECPMGCLGHGGQGVCPHCGDWHADDRSCCSRPATPPAAEPDAGDVEALTSHVLDALHAAHHRPGNITMLDLARSVAEVLASDWLADRVADARRDGGVAALTEAAADYERMYQQPGSATGADWLRHRAVRLAGGDS